MNRQYESELNRRSNAEHILRDLNDQEKVLELLEIPEELDNIAEFRPTEENCRSFWSHMMEERRQSLEMQNLNKDLRKRASLLSKEQAMYQRQKEQLHSLVVGYMREKGGEVTEKMGQLQNLYHIFAMEEKCRTIFCRPAKDLPIHTDLPRLVRSFDVRKQGKSLFAPPPETPVQECVLQLLTILAEEVDGPEVVPEIHKSFTEATEDSANDDLQKLLLTFFSNPKVEGWSSVAILKACNQAIIAPFVTRLKNAMDAHLPFNSTRNGWTITLQLGTEKITVVHKKREVAAPEAIDSFGQFEFEWKVEIQLEVDVMTIGSAFAAITENVNLGMTWEDVDFKDEFEKCFWEFKEILRKCITTSMDDSNELEKRVKRLKEKIHRQENKLKEKKERLETKRKQKDKAKQKAFTKGAQKRQQKQIKKLKKSINAGGHLEPEEVRMVEAFSEVGLMERPEVYTGELEFP